MKDFLLGLVYISVFLVLFIPTMVNDTMFFPYITGKNFAFRILVEVGFASYVILALLDKNYRPRFSYILVSATALIVVMFFADLLGRNPHNSFWSNFERMDGYITLVHFYLYFFVLGHVLRTKNMWSYFLHTSLAVASYVALYGLAQSAGVVDGRTRVDSTLGNASYMAVYMLFHIFILLFVAIRSREWISRAGYIAVLVLFVYILLETGTRGTFLGMVGGFTLAIGYLAFFSRAYQELRRFALYGLIALVAFVGIFFAFRDSEFIKNSYSLGRIANISIEDDIIVRSTIWSMALEGVKERPLLGWGQSNFNYVFNREYEPSLYSQEQWFDRAHNIIFDWLIAGGILGLIAYFSILFSALYYLFWLPIRYGEGDEATTMNVMERAVLLGLLGGYCIHNFVVFDNIVSYVYYAVILALIHSRYSAPIMAVERKEFNRDIVTTIFAPSAIVLAIALIYFLHVPGILVAKDIINAYRATDADSRFGEFRTALDRDSFARQEIVEQLSQQAMSLATQPNVPDEVRQKYLAMAETEILNLIELNPGDARLHVFLAGFYRSTGRLDLAAEQIVLARSLSPRKQSIIQEQAFIELAKGNGEGALKIFSEAYELDKTNYNALFFYAGALLYLNREEEALALVPEEYFSAFAQNQFALGAAERSLATTTLIRMFEERIKVNPLDAQNRASLAFIHYRNGDLDMAVAALEEGAVNIPSFAPLAECFIANIKIGKVPDEGC